MTATDTKSPGPRGIFAEPEPDDRSAAEVCAATCVEYTALQCENERLQSELAAARQLIEHLSRLALRARNAQAGR